MGSSNANVNDLFQNAEAQGVLSPTSMKVMTVDMGKRIQAGLGISVDDVLSTSGVTLVSQLMDDSGSIRFAGNAQIVRDGHNLVLKSLRASKQSPDILAHTRYLNGTILFPFTPLVQAVEMDTNNYNPNGGTPLYDESIVILGTVAAKTQEFSDNGLHARSVTLITSDGHDEGSRKPISAVAPLVRDMLMSENHIIAAMGIDDGRTDFRAIFREMGIEDKWILTPGNSESEIRKAFALFSQSAIRASQGAVNFSKTSLGGFGV